MICLYQYYKKNNFKIYMDMDYVHTISTFVITNKWSIIFILFAIFAAYSLGVQYASTRKAESEAEGFKPSCGIDKKIPLEPEVPVVSKPPSKTKPEDKTDKPEKPDKTETCTKPINRQRNIVVIKSKQRYDSGDDDDDNNQESDDDDNDDNTEKNNCPNMKDYVLKNAVRKNFISKRVVDSNYVKKEECLAEIEKNKKALKEIRDSLEKKREAHMEREREDLERQKQVLIDQREKLRILRNKYEKQQNNEVCDKKISNLKKKETVKQRNDESSEDGTDEDVSNRNNKKKRAIYQKHINPPAVIESHDCDTDDEENKYNLPKKTVSNPYEKLQKKIPDMLKQQDMFDKNRTAMEDNYNYINDAYSTCNMGNCAINGLPSGLKPRL
jgi:hypothetical protein